MEIEICEARCHLTCPECGYGFDAHYDGPWLKPEEIIEQMEADYHCEQGKCEYCNGTNVVGKDHEV